MAHRESEVERMSANHNWPRLPIDFRPKRPFPIKRRVPRLAILAVAVLSFATGSLITAARTRVYQLPAAVGRVFQLNVYHAVPGKTPQLEARFDSASKLLAKHNLTVIGYWVPNGDPAWDNTFLYIVAGSSRQEMERNWDAFHADPAFQEY